MLKEGDLYLVMGLLDPDSIAYAIGRTLSALGARVIYTAQSERIKGIFLDRDSRLTDAERAALEIRYCDVTVESELAAVFEGLPGPLAGVVHSIAYANPRTCLGEEFHTAAVPDLTQAFHISCVSLASVARHAVPRMTGGGALVALTFDADRAYPYYNWMGVNKAALEALVRALARRHGRDGVRVNAVSAGPLFSKAASKIPGFGKLDKIWSASSPLEWDTHADKQEVANAVAFLLGTYSRKITGQVLRVDGGASIVAGELMEFERNPGRATAG